MREPVKWYDANAKDISPFLDALATVRKKAVHEGWCYHHVQAILISIDQYAEAATGNREFFWNRPPSLVSNPAEKADVPWT